MYITFLLELETAIFVSVFAFAILSIVAAKMAQVFSAHK